MADQKRVRNAARYYGRCIYNGKVRYPTSTAARAERKWLLRKPHYDYVRVYECPHCKGWHITSQKKITGK